jgi:hypothetical protein
MNVKNTHMDRNAHQWRITQTTGPGKFGRDRDPLYRTDQAIGRCHDLARTLRGHPDRIAEKRRHPEGEPDQRPGDEIPEEKRKKSRRARDQHISPTLRVNVRQAPSRAGRHNRRLVVRCHGKGLERAPSRFNAQGCSALRARERRLATPIAQRAVVDPAPPSS